MVRKNTNLHKVQQKIFREAYTAEGYLKTMDGIISKYDDTWQKTDAVYNTMMCIIFEMSWLGDYHSYCENEKSLTAQALSQN